ncbi:MAG: preprotein translocase subunit SecA [Planctomycetota bacterium]
MIRSVSSSWGRRNKQRSSEDSHRLFHPGQALRKFLSDQPITALVSSVELAASEARRWSNQEFLRQFETLRGRLCINFQRLTQDDCLVTLTGLIVEGLRRGIDVNLYSEQIQAGLVVASGGIAEMQTGEGKTYATFLPACLMAIRGNGVHVSCPNDYLANRDGAILGAAFEQLGFTAHVIRDDTPPEEKRRAYRSDVVHAASHIFGFDFLRDRLAIRQQAVSWKQRMRAGQTPQAPPSTLQRPLHAAIVDEADHVLLDDAMSPLILSGGSADLAQDADLHHWAKQRAIDMVVETDFQVDTAQYQIRWNDEGLRECYQKNWPQDDLRLRRPWHDYVLNALKARHLFQRQRDYVVSTNSIRLVDRTTGRVFADRTWSDGVHQAIQAKEDLPITDETTSASTTTRQAYYCRYRWMGGMTGTADGCRRELRDVYSMSVQPIRLRTPSRRCILTDAVFSSESEKHDALAIEAKICRDIGRAMLIGTLRIDESNSISDRLHELSIEHEVLNGVQDHDEASIIAKAGRQGAVTVATSLAGRGTDIRLDPVVFENGGLHVAVSQPHALARVDRQLVGRCGRAGDPGTARHYFSVDDDLPRMHAPWLSQLISEAASDPERQFVHDQIRDELTAPEEVPANVVRRHVQDIQARIQFRESQSRIQMINQKQQEDRWQRPATAWEPTSVF